MNLEEFKANAATIKRTLCESMDTVDFEHGIMVIHEKNLMKYLEKYACKNEEDLSDSLYYNYGVYLTVIHDD